MIFNKQSEYDSQQFKQLSAANERIINTEFFDCIFIDCLFNEATFKQCHFQNCEFKRCDLSLVHWTGSTFQNGRFQQTKLIGVDWSRLAWSKYIKESPLHFDSCILDYGTFIGLNLHKQKMVDCSIKDVDFSDADLTKATFERSDLTRTQFRNTNITKANFQQARNYDINPQRNKVSQAQFSMPEAIALLHSLDIKLID